MGDNGRQTFPSANEMLEILETEGEQSLKDDAAYAIARASRPPSDKLAQDLETPGFNAIAEFLSWHDSQEAVSMRETAPVPEDERVTQPFCGADKPSEQNGQRIVDDGSYMKSLGSNKPQESAKRADTTYVYVCEERAQRIGRVRPAARKAFF